MSSLVTQSELELMFGAERVAQVFSVILPDGSSSGEADADAVAFGIRMGSAEFERSSFGVYPDGLPTPVPDTVKQLVGIFVMHGGLMRRPEYASDPKKSPYYADYVQARADLAEIRKATQLISRAVSPSNVGGELAHANPDGAQPFYFMPDPGTGDGGFGGY